MNIPLTVYVNIIFKDAKQNQNFAEFMPKFLPKLDTISAEFDKCAVYCMWKGLFNITITMEATTRKHLFYYHSTNVYASAIWKMRTKNGNLKDSRL